MDPLLSSDEYRDVVLESASTRGVHILPALCSFSPVLICLAGGTPDGLGVIVFLAASCFGLAILSVGSNLRDHPKVGEAEEPVKTGPSMHQSGSSADTPRETAPLRGSKVSDKSPAPSSTRDLNVDSDAAAERLGNTSGFELCWGGDPDAPAGRTGQNEIALFMRDNSQSRLFGYGLSLLCTGLATILYLLLQPFLGGTVPYITFFPAIFITAYFTRFGPTLLAVAFSAVAAAYWAIPPADSLLPADGPGWLGLALFCLLGIAVALLGERMHRKSSQIARERERFSVTLASIGDGVIVTDDAARVTYINSVAEELTGWPLAEARGKPLETVFQIVDEQTREKADNPVTRALRRGGVVGLPNHTILIARDGTERAIDDSAAPVRDYERDVLGVVLVFRDVTEKRSSQIASGRLAALVDSSEDAIIGQTFEGDITDWNFGAERLFGIPADEAVGRSMFETVVPTDRKDELLDKLRRVQQGERVEQFETVRQCRDKREIDVAVRISPILDQEGNVVGASAIDRDISGQKKAEMRRNARLAVTQILAQNQDVATTVSQVLAAVGSALEWDAGCYWQFQAADGTLRCLVFWQEPSQDRKGFRTATQELVIGPGRTLPGRVWENQDSVWIPDVTAEPNFIRASEAQEAGLHGGFACPVQVGKDFLGVVEWFSPEFEEPDENLLETMSTIGGLLGQFIERKESERAVRESERLYRAIGESIDYGVWVCDSEGRNVYVSDSFLELVGITQEECSEFGWGKVLHPDDAEETIAAWKECVRTEGTWDREHRFLGVDGEYHPILARGVPVRDDQDNVVYWAGINLDISRLKEVEHALRDADRHKDEFLAMLAHELRNPLTPIRSGLDLLAMDPGKDRETVTLMQDQVEHLVRLVDDLLDVSRIMRGRIELRKEAVEMTGLVQRSVHAVEHLIQGRRQKLHESVPEEPVWLDADPVRIMQVIENLLNNASKYTDEGGRIELTAEQQNGQAVIRVRDTGIGIEPEFLSNIFDLFTQSQRTLDRSQGGLGIGLTLVRQLVEMHGGNVAVESEGPGHGSTFTVCLPVAEESPASDHPEDQPQLARNLRILVVDDNAGATYLLSKLLEKLGNHVIDMAHDGPSAVKKVKQQHPALVLLDIGLPGMNGYEVAREIRQNGEFNDVLLVALTGYGQEDDLRNSKDAGFDEHLIKPPSVEQMKQLLADPRLVQ